MTYRTLTRVATRIALALLCALLGFAPAVSAAAPGDTSSVTGSVVDQSSGLAIPNATVTLTGGGKSAEATTDASGRFTFPNVGQGIYQVTVVATGFQGQRSGDVAVLTNSTSSVSFVLNRTRSANEYKTIATVTSSAGNALASTATVTKSVDPALLSNLGYNRYVGALLTLPGVNFSGNLTAASGDDSSIDIRGIGPTETVALLDGHPAGPQGVYPINGGGAFATSFNYSDSPFYALNKVQVTYGAGAGGLYGVDAVGGTVDMQTLNPTRDPHSTGWLGYGNEGQQLAAFQATGSLNRVGYAFAASTQGSYGMYQPGQQIAQTAYPVTGGGQPPFNGCPAQPNFDLTSCGLGFNTYGVSANNTLKSALAKLTYNLSNNTSILGSFYTSGQWADSTGNGDADNVPYDTRLAQIQQNAGTCSLPTDPAGTMSGYLVSTNTNPNACYTAQQFAAATSGPAGGGQGRNRGTGMFDYHLRAQTRAGKSTYTADYFFNHFKFYKDSTQSLGAIVDPSNGLYPGPLYTQWDNTQGILVSDEIVNENSDIAFGYFVNHQLQTRLNQLDQGWPWGNEAYIPDQTYGYASVFAKGDFNLTPQLSAFANVWATRSSVTQKNNIDPRLSLVWRPKSGSDVVRVAFGHATGDPAAELRVTYPLITQNPASMNPHCGQSSNAVGEIGDPNLTAESANDLEVGYAHRFKGDSNVSVNLYSTTVDGQLYSASLPFTNFPGAAISPALLQGFANKLSGCPGVSTSNPSSIYPLLSLQYPTNTGQGRFQGVEIVGRQRVARQLAFDYSYDIQKASLNNIPDALLQSNWVLIPGGQIPLIPMHKATLAADITPGDGWELNITGNYVGNNNPEERPAFTYFNGFVNKQLTGLLSLNLGVQNIFNQDVQYYGYFGHQQFFPENKYGTDANSIQQYLNGNTGGYSMEQFGIAPTTVILTLQMKM